MPWKESRVMDQRARFIREWEGGERAVTDLCAEYGVSRTVGYKWIRRFQATGIDGLRDHSRRPRSSPTATSAEMIEHIVAVRMKHPSWGGRKLARILMRQHRRAVPSPSTIDNVLRRLGFTRTRVRRHRPSSLSSWPRDLRPQYSWRPVAPHTSGPDVARVGLTLTLFRRG